MVYGYGERLVVAYGKKERREKRGMRDREGREKEGKRGTEGWSD